MMHPTDAEDLADELIDALHNPEVDVRRRRSHERQERAQDTVTWILSAFAELVEARGVEAVTMRDLAERAGFAVGTMYRYFADKSSLVAELVQKRRVDQVQRVLTTLQTMRDRPLREVIEAVLGTLFDPVLAQPRLHAELIRQLDSVVDLNNVYQVTQRLVVPATAFLESRRHELIPTDVAQAAYVCVSNLQTALLHLYLLAERDPQRARAYRDENIAATVRYLVR